MNTPADQTKLVAITHITNQVSTYRSFVEKREELVARIFKECCSTHHKMTIYFISRRACPWTLLPDLGRAVHQIHWKQCALTLRIGPALDVSFPSNSSFDHPLSWIWWKGADRCKWTSASIVTNYRSSALRCTVCWCRTITWSCTVRRRSSCCPVARSWSIAWRWAITRHWSWRRSVAWSWCRSRPVTWRW